LGIAATIFMPEATPNQKVERVRHCCDSHITVVLAGGSYDDAQQAALEHCERTGATLVHPFDDLRTIAGQGTIGKEIHDDLDQAEGTTPPFAFLVAPIGGGGLISGLAACLKPLRPALAIIGAEPQGSPSMHAALQAGHPVTLKEIDTFIDGAAVKRVGDLTFQICSTHLDSVQVIPEGAVCTTMIDLYQNEGIIAEPAGALSVAALDAIADRIVGTTVVCILSGGNNDILRYPEIMERSLIHQGRKHYFLISFAQKPGQLRAFVDSALGPTDDIVRFEYLKKTNKERGPALVGLELASAADLSPLLERMDQIGLGYRRLDASEALYDYLI
jgi:threonine dehydratase